MIYLYGSSIYPIGKGILKIGYAKNLEERMKQYKIHNPGGKLLSSREGDEILELKLHILAEWKRLKLDILDEWFEDDDELISLFSWTTDKIDETIWKNRYDILITPFLPQPGTKKRKILDDLSEKYKELPESQKG